MIPLSNFALLYCYKRPTNDEEDASAPPPKIQEAIKNNDIDNLLDLDWDEPATAGSSSLLSGGGSMGELMSLDTQSTQQQSTNHGGSSMDDIMKLYSSNSQPSPTVLMSSPISNPVMQSPSTLQQQFSPQQQNSSAKNDLFDLSSISEPQQPSTNNTNTKADPFAGLF